MTGVPRASAQRCARVSTGGHSANPGAPVAGGVAGEQGEQGDAVVREAEHPRRRDDVSERDERPSPPKVGRGERGPSERYPLRGLLLCPRCGKPETASTTKGRTGRYGYYRCHRCAKDGHAQRHRERVIHDAFAANLADVAVPAGVAAVWRELVAETARETTSAARQRATASGWTGWGVSSARQRGRPDVEGAAHVRFALDVLEDLPSLWARSDAEGQRVLAGSLWPDGFVFEGAGFAFGQPSPLIALFDTLQGEMDGRRPRLGDRRPVRYAREDSNL